MKFNMITFASHASDVPLEPSLLPYSLGQARNEELDNIASSSDRPFSHQGFGQCLPGFVFSLLEERILSIKI